MRRRIHQEGKAAAEEMRRAPDEDLLSFAPCTGTSTRSRSTAPPERVFPHVVESASAWSGWVRSQESEPLTDGEPGAGTRYRDVFVDHGQRIELEAEVVRYEPPGYLEVSLRGDGVEATSSQRLEESTAAAHASPR